MQIVPPQILSYRYKKERPVGFKIRQNPFSTGTLPRTPLGSSRRSPRPPSRLRKGHPYPYSTPRGTNPPSTLAMRPPPRILARSTPMHTPLFPLSSPIAYPLTFSHLEVGPLNLAMGHNVVIIIVISIILLHIHTSAGNRLQHNTMKTKTQII